MKNNYINSLTFINAWSKKSFLLLVIFTLCSLTTLMAQDYANSDFEVDYYPLIGSNAAGVGIGAGNEAFNEVGITALGSNTN